MAEVEHEQEQEQNSLAGDDNEEELEPKTIKILNTKAVMEALNEIGEPAAARDVVSHISRRDKVKAEDIRGTVLSVLRRGYNAGFIVKDGEEYVPVAMQAARRRSRSRRRMASRSKSRSRSPSRRRSPRRRMSRRTRY